MQLITQSVYLTKVNPAPNSPKSEATLAWNKPREASWLKNQNM